MRLLPRCFHVLVGALLCMAAHSNLAASMRATGITKVYRMNMYNICRFFLEQVLYLDLLVLTLGVRVYGIL